MQDVSPVNQRMDQTHDQQDGEPPGKPTPVVESTLFLPAQLNIKAKTESQGKDGIGFTTDQEENHLHNDLVCFGRKEKVVLGFIEEIEMLYEVDKYDTQQRKPA